MGSLASKARVGLNCLPKDPLSVTKPRRMLRCLLPQTARDRRPVTVDWLAFPRVSCTWESYNTHSLWNRPASFHSAYSLRNSFTRPHASLLSGTRLPWTGHGLFLHPPAGGQLGCFRPSRQQIRLLWAPTAECVSAWPCASAAGPRRTPFSGRTFCEYSLLVWLVFLFS